MNFPPIDRCKQQRFFVYAAPIVVKTVQLYGPSQVALSSVWEWNALQAAGCLWHWALSIGALSEVAQAFPEALLFRRSSLGKPS